jgi:Chaperone of endosialidase
LYVTGEFSEAADGVEFRHSNGTQGIGFGFNSIYVTGANAAQHLNLIPRGVGFIGLDTTGPARRVHIEGKTSRSCALPTGGCGLNAYWDFQVFQNDRKLQLIAWDNVVGSFNGFTGAYTSSSDLRMKQDIEPLTGPLDAALRLRPVRCRFKADPAAKHRNMGFIAQDVEQVSFQRPFQCEAMGRFLPSGRVIPGVTLEEGATPPASARRSPRRVNRPREAAHAALRSGWHHPAGHHGPVDPARAGVPRHRRPDVHVVRHDPVRVAGLRMMFTGRTGQQMSATA